MIRVNEDKNKGYRKFGFTLDKEVKDKIIHVNSLLNGNRNSFCIKLQDIITPIKDSFDKILSNPEKSIINRININKIMNNVVLLFLSELEEDIKSKSRERFSPKLNGKTPPFPFSLKK